MINEQERIEEVAFLRSKGRKIAAIAKMLQLAPATVDSLLNKAEGQGLYREIVHFDYEKVAPERIKQLRLLDHVEHLRDRLRASAVDPHERSKTIFQQVYVFDSGSVDDSPRGLRTRLAKFGFEAAPSLAEFLFHSGDVGIAWGGTLSSVIRNLDAIRLKDFQGHKNIRFVPTCGEPYGNSSREDSSSFLVAELDQRVNGNNPKRLSLTGIPVVLPNKFAESGEDEIIRRFIQHCPAYREIFGPNDSKQELLIDKLETILTSVGASESHWRMCGMELCEIGGIERVAFEKIALGDLGGVLLPRSEYPSDEEKRLLEKICGLWTGITFEHYRRVAKKGDNHRGVVVFAIGANKARIVCRAIRAGLVNHLVCDQALAWALCRECGAPSPDDLPLLIK